MKPIVLFVEDIKDLTKEKLIELLQSAYEQGFTDGYSKGIASTPISTPIQPTPMPYSPYNPVAPIITCESGVKGDKQ